MGKKKTQQDFQNEVFAKVGVEYGVIGKYLNANIHLDMIHNVCGFIYSVTPHKFLQGRRCPKCQKRLRRNTELFIKEVFDLVGEEYTVIGEFVRVEEKIMMRHNKCGHYYSVKPKHFLCSKSKCPSCFKKEKWSNSYFLSRVFDEVGNEYTFLEEYKGYDEHLQIRHNRCGYEYTVTPNKFLGKVPTRCPACSNVQTHEAQRKSIDQIEREIFQKFNNEFKLISEYRGAFEEITVLHEKCNKEITYSNAKNFLQGAGFCPYCDKGGKISRGIKKIVNFLVKHNFSIKTEYSFKDCLYRRQLFFDIAAFYQGKLICLIEYDGQQHFTPSPIFGGIEQYIENRIKDGIKNHYCENKNIPLIRIAYDQIEEYEKMLTSFLRDHGFSYILNSACAK